MSPLAPHLHRVRAAASEKRRRGAGGPESDTRERRACSFRLRCAGCGECGVLSGPLDCKVRGSFELQAVLAISLVFRSGIGDWLGGQYIIVTYS